MFIGTGYFSLEPGEEKEIIYATILSQGIGEMFDKADFIQVSQKENKVVTFFITFKDNTVSINIENMEQYFDLSNISLFDKNTKNRI